MLRKFQGVPWGVTPRAVLQFSLAVAICLIGWRDLAFQGRLFDSAIYVRGFADVQAGADPYAIRDFATFVYPPPSAGMGAWLVELAGVEGARVLVRTIVFAGALWLGWLVASRYRLRWRAVWAAVLALGCTTALDHGNASPAVVALAFFALTRERDDAAGILVGLSLVVKPLLIPALPALMLWRRRSAGWAIATAGVLIFATGPAALHRWLDLIAFKADGWAHAPLNLAPHAFLWRMGLEVPAFVWAGLVGLAAAPFARRPASMLAACAVGTTVLWSGTLIPLLVPAAGLALSRVFGLPSARFVRLNVRVRDEGTVMLKRFVGRTDDMLAARGDGPPRSVVAPRAAGMSLIEILVVIAVIGIVAAIALPQVLARAETRRAGECERVWEGVVAIASGPGATAESIQADVAGAENPRNRAMPAVWDGTTSFGSCQVKVTADRGDFVLSQQRREIDRNVRTFRVVTGEGGR